MATKTRKKAPPLIAPALPRFIQIGDTVYHHGEVFTVALPEGAVQTTLFLFNPDETKRVGIEFRGGRCDGHNLHISYHPEWDAHNLFVLFSDIGDRRRLAGLPTYYHYNGVIEGYTVRAVKLCRDNLTDAPFATPVVHTPGLKPGTQFNLFS